MSTCRIWCIYIKHQAGNGFPLSVIGPNLSRDFDRCGTL
jgi:hypothetical protein